MCGRYVVTNAVHKTTEIVKSAIAVSDTDNFNASPQQKLPVIKSYDNGKTIESLWRGSFLHIRTADHRHRAGLRPHHQWHRRSNDRLVRYRHALLRYSQRTPGAT